MTSYATIKGCVSNFSNVGIYHREIKIERMIYFKKLHLKLKQAESQSSLCKVYCSFHSSQVGNDDKMLVGKSSSTPMFQRSLQDTL